MKNLVLIIFILQIVQLALLNGQNETARSYIERSNNYYKSMESGRVLIHQVKYKGAFSDDTTYYSGDLYFWRDSFDVNDNCRFMVVHDQNIIAASDLKNYYFSLSDSLHQTAIVNTDSEKELKSSSQRSNLLPKFILKRHAGTLDPSLIEKARVVNQIDEDKIVIEVSDSFPNTLGDKGGRKYINFNLRLHLSTKSYAITKLEEWIHAFEQPQYRALEISEIIPLSKNEILYSDSLFATFSNAGVLKIENTESQTGNKSKITKDDTLKDFRLPAINSSSPAIALSDFSEGLIILDFWYKACYPCLLAMPALEDIHRKHHKDKVFVLGINPYDKNKDNLLSFLAKRDITYPTLLDESGQITKDLDIQAFPTILVIEAKTQKIVEVFKGYSEEDEKRIQEIIQASIK